MKTLSIAIWYRTDGTSQHVKPHNGQFFTYEESQYYVGDGENKMVEIVPMPSGLVLIGNEEAKLINLPKNEQATEIWKKEYPIDKYVHNNDELICGNVLICSPELLEQ